MRHTYIKYFSVLTMFDKQTMFIQNVLRFIMINNNVDAVEKVWLKFNPLNSSEFYMGSQENVKKSLKESDNNKCYITFYQQYQFL